MERNEQFIGEIVRPVGGAFETSAMAAGEPGVPRAFVWRKKEFRLVRVLEKWKALSSCRHGSGEQYVRKHWYRILTADGTVMTLYFDRQPRRGHKPTERWCLYAVSRTAGDT